MPPPQNLERGALERRIVELEQALVAYREQEAQRRVVLHQIRSPLTAVIGFAETLSAQVGAGTLEPGRLKDRLIRIAQAARRVDALLDTLDGGPPGQDGAGSPVGTHQQPGAPAQGVL